ncbi:hypothetical protein F5Y08DRAFT_346858 [Xylaria arbuscula]|nr:hypothetical protein F5Y08DRAFT_346858 [Xylaria arbuscula]
MASEAKLPEVAAPKPHAQDVTSFLNLLNLLVADTSATWIKQVMEDNERMKAAIREKDEKTEAASRSFVLAISEVSRKLDIANEESKKAIAESEEAKTKAGELTTAIENAKSTIAERDQKLQDDATKITGLEGNVEALGKEVQTRDETIKTQKEQQEASNARIKELKNSLTNAVGHLETTTGHLKDLQDLSWQIADGSREFVLREIDRIYEHAKRLAVNFFSEDLPEVTFSNTLIFDEIRRLVRPIPFPVSNSPAAKKARIAAFLASLGSRLGNMIFLPYYTRPNDEDDNEKYGNDAITILLSDLSQSDPKRELHLRSVLLATSPGEQKKIAHERAEIIAMELYHIMGVFLSGEQQPKFGEALRRFCHEAVESWDLLRNLKEKVEPFMQTEEDTEKYWLPAELDTGSQVVAAKQADGSGKPNGLGSKPSLHSLKSAKKVIFVWPGFSYGSEVLKQGFMLLDSQVRSADEESASPHSKRNQRAMQRAMTGSPVQNRRTGTPRLSR